MWIELNRDQNCNTAQNRY